MSLLDHPPTDAERAEDERAARQVGRAAWAVCLFWLVAPAVVLAVLVVRGV